MAVAGVVGGGYWLWNHAGPGARRNAVRFQVEGLRLLEEGRLKAAEGKLRASLAFQPRNPDVVGALAELLFTQGRRRELRALIWQMLPDASPQDRVRWLSMVWGSYHDNRLSEIFYQARDRLTRALAVEPVYENRFGLAVAYLIRGQPEDLRIAQEYLVTCLHERPGALEASLRLVECLMERQELAAAEKVLIPLAERHPRDAELLRLRARLAVARGREDEALAAYRELVDTSPGDVEAHLQLGLMLKRRGDEAGSRFHLERYQRSTGLVREADQLLLDLEQAPTGGGAAARCRRLGEITEAMGRDREAAAWRDVAEALGAEEGRAGSYR